MALRMYRGECEPRVGGRRNYGKTVGISSKGVITIARDVAAMLPKLNRVTLHADMEANPPMIAFKFVRDDEAAGFTARIGKQAHSPCVRAKGFLTWLGMDLKAQNAARTRHPAIYDESKKMLIIRLEGCGEKGSG